MPGLPGGMPASAPIELIDVVFALSNIRLVKEIVQDNLRQLDQLDRMGMSKGQTEGLKAMIMEKQKQAYADLEKVEQTLNAIVEESVAPAGVPPQRDVSLGADQSRALITALAFAISHLMKFMPQPAGGPGEVPGTII